MSYDYQAPANLNAVEKAQESVQQVYDYALEAERKRREIGYQINDYPAQTTSQPYNS